MRKAVRSAALLLVLAVLTGAIGFAEAQDKKDKKDAKAVATFELYKDSGGEFRFRLKDEEGTILASATKGYGTKADCQKVVDTIKAVAAKAKVDDQTK